MLRHLFIHLLILQPLKTNVKNLQNNNLQMLKCKAKGVHGKRTRFRNKPVRLLDLFHPEPALGTKMIH